MLRSCVEDDLKTEGKDARHTLLPSLEEERIEQLDGVTFRLTSSTWSQVAPQPAFYCYPGWLAVSVMNNKGVS